MNDTLQSAPVLGSGSSVPDGDGGGEDEPTEGGVVHRLKELDGLMTGSAAVGIQGEDPSSVALPEVFSVFFGLYK